ncbi:MAG: NAD-dependent epimerase/dehydratase family protein [Pseudomonadota bacterium]
MTSKKYLVTGGAGFIGAALVKRLAAEGHNVRVLDNFSRGDAHRLAGLRENVELISGDIRDGDAVRRSTEGVDSVIHLAYVNGTEFFYSQPELVLDVGVRGMINVLDACRSEGVRELVLASSSEVYQTPPTVPTPETVPLSVPDPHNPRYSYGGGKIISELMALNYGRSGFDRVMIFRPHNVYGPVMGWEHVIPQLTLRLKRLCETRDDPVRLPIQGTGEETRAFVFIDDFVDGVMILLHKGRHLGIYHIGTMDEAPISRIVELAAEYLGRKVEIVPGPSPEGGTLRRCPDISKMSELGYKPGVSLREGLFRTMEWYLAHPSEHSKA